MNPSPAIEVTNLGKTYGAVTAIEDLSLTVQTGEIFGLLGPNGAGKSTTLRILITVLPPSSGTARVLGHDVRTEADTVRSLIGYVPQERAIDRFLTGREHLELLGDLYHLPKHDAKTRIDELLRLVNLEEHADRVAKTYSGGMKRKLDIACGLLPNPNIVFLDEPTLGLDVQSRLRIWGLHSSTPRQRPDDRHDHQLPGRSRPTLRPTRHYRPRKHSSNRFTQRTQSGVGR